MCLSKHFVRCIYTGENYVLVISKMSDADISCWRYERNLLAIFQCHWELVKISHRVILFGKISLDSPVSKCNISNVVKIIH